MFLAVTLPGTGRGWERAPIVAEKAGRHPPLLLAAAGGERGAERGICCGQAGGALGEMVV